MDEELLEEQEEEWEPDIGDLWDLQREEDIDRELFMKYGGESIDYTGI